MEQAGIALAGVLLLCRPGATPADEHKESKMDNGHDIIQPQRRRVVESLLLITEAVSGKITYSVCLSRFSPQRRMLARDWGCGSLVRLSPSTEDQSGCAAAPLPKGMEPSSWLTFPEAMLAARCRNPLLELKPPLRRPWL